MAARAQRAELGDGERRTRDRDPIRSAVRTTPAATDGHVHCVIFNGQTGRGSTSPGPDGHTHAVRFLEILSAAGHTHDLSASRCVERHDVEGRHVQTRK